MSLVERNKQRRALVKKGDLPGLWVFLPNQPDREWLKAAETALEFGRLDVLEALLERGFDVDFQRGQLLEDAAEVGNIKQVKFLLGRGASPHRGTPLVCAVQSGKAAVVSLLLQAGADPNHGYIDMPTPLAMAREERQKKIERILVEAGATTLVGESDGLNERERAIKAAVEADDGAALIELVRDESEDERAFLFQDAIDREPTGLAVATALLDGGLSVEATIHGPTLLGRASSAGALKIVRLLLDRGASLQGIPLVGAASSGDIETARLLLDAGADPNHGFPGFPTPLAAARSERDKAMECLLVEAGATALVGVKKGQMKSPGGSHVFVHGGAEAVSLAPRGEHRAELREALQATFGPITRTVEDPAPVAVHVDLHLIAPTPARSHWTVLTEGMSDRAATLPYATHEKRLTELVLELPASWDMDGALDPTSDAGWPLAQLRLLARIPHVHQTGLVVGDTIPNGDPPEPFHSSTQLCCWLLVPPGLKQELVLPLVEPVYVLNMFGLHANEMQLKLDKGLVGLMTSLDWKNMSTVVDPDRPSGVKKKRFFGLF